MNPSTATHSRREITVASAIALLLVAALLALVPQRAEAEVRQIRFPVGGGASWVDTFGAPRSGGRSHAGQDLFAPKMTWLVATTDARVVRMGRKATLSGNYVVLRDSDGWEYVYVHLNNDTPGTDDGADRDLEAFWPGIRVGQKVWAGQALGYLGDSGNAETTPPHLHFEIRNPSGESINPADSLRAASHEPINPAFVAAHSPTGNIDGMRLAPGGASIAGWTYDPDTALPIEASFYADKNFSGDLSADKWRADLAYAFPEYGGQHAFDGAVPLPLGRSQVCGYGLNDDRGYAAGIGCKAFTVPSGQIGSIDTIERVSDGIRVTGWAIDPDTSSPIDVYVSNGAAARYARASEVRWDVAAAYPGFGTPHGFDVVLPVGPEQTYFCVTGVNVQRGQPSHIGCALGLSTLSPSARSRAA